MRGRLIYRFLAEVVRLDAAASAYDSVLREFTTTRDHAGPAQRATLPPVRVPCQYQAVSQDQADQSASGRDPSTVAEITFHYQNLEEMGLVDPTTGTPLFRNGDRLAAVYTLDGELVRSYDPPLVAFIDTDESFGLRGLRRNLLGIEFRRRRRGPP